MMLVRFMYKTIRKATSVFSLLIDDIRCRFLLRVEGVDFQQDISCKGRPQIHLGKQARMSIGSGFRMNNGIKYNRIGRQGPCQFMLGENAEIRIGNDVGMSSTAIICKQSITLGDRVKIGGNVVIYDTDFHSLDAATRADMDKDEQNRTDRAVHIGDDVFIGAHSTVLKGVTIGKGAVIGACSVVTKDVPAGEVWAGNPAKCIRRAMRKSTAA